MYAIELTKEFGMSRDELMRQLADIGIETRTFFCPLNQQPCLARVDGFDATPCPVADRMWQNGIYLPSSHGLTEKEVAIVAESIVVRGAQ
jgi:perosamine synthetase